VFVAPVVNTLERIVKAVLSLGQKRMKMLNLEQDSAGLHELQAAVALARTSRVIGAREEKIVLSAAQLASRPIRQLMLPAGEISMIPLQASLSDALLMAHLDLHTRFPVCAKEGDPQSIKGYITFKDLVVAIKMKTTAPTVEGIIRPIKRLPENMFIAQVLEQMMREKVHIALVVSTTWDVLGMVTLEDIVEEMLGDIEDEFDHLPTHFHTAGQGWIMGGGVSMETVFKCLGITAPNPTSANLRLAEWANEMLHRPVTRGDVIRAEGLEVFVRKLRRRKLSEAFISRQNA
jgi:putative hemolysin